MKNNSSNQADKNIIELLHKLRYMVADLFLSIKVPNEDRFRNLRCCEPTSKAL